MSLYKKTLCCFCAFVLTITAILPCLMTLGAGNSDERIVLTDGTEWLVEHDDSHNTMSTDGEGRYYIKTDSPNDNNSAFSIMSKSVYPISTKFQLQCREALEASTSFGLSSAYSLDMKDTNSIRIFRQNGYGNENAVRLYVLLENKEINIKTTAAQFTRNRVSTIGVTKQNGSWYMTWNNIVLDGTDCTEDVKNYLKLENHFPADALENGISLHFFASCERLLTTDNAFLFKADRKISNGVMSVYSDSYSDMNDPSSIKKSTCPKSDFNADNGKYSLSLESESTSVAVMSPVALIDSEKGESDVFNVETYIENVIMSSQYWIEYGFSTDPLFSDGSEKSFCAVKIENNGGVHIGHFAPGWTTFCGTNNNFFNDPESSSRLWQFKKSNDGNIYLNIWGANLTAANAPVTVGIDFSSYADKPIYMRITARGIGNSVLKADVTPYTGEKTASLVNEADTNAQKNPSNLEEAEKIVNEYDASPYRYAISDAGLAKVLETRMYMYDELDKALKKRIDEIENKIKALPAPEELAENYNTALKNSICEIYLDYTSLGNDMVKVDANMSEKIKALLNKLTEIDQEFAAKKIEAENFGDNVNNVKALGKITVDNYLERNEKIQSLRNSYNEMDAFLKSIVDAEALNILEALESELAEVKDAYYVATLINALPPQSEVDLADQNAIVAARKEYDLLSNKDQIPPQLLKKLEDCEKQLENVKIQKLDWYSAFPEVSYTGDNDESYSFENTCDKVSGYAFATTTKKYDMSQNELYWIGMGCGGGQFMMLGLANSVKGQQLNNKTTDNICFILRPAAGDTLMVTFFDENGEAEQVKNLSGFNLATVHKFGFEKAEDNHWYLTIDGEKCNDRFYDRLDNYMESYGKDTHISIGGCNGFRASNVMIADKNSTGYTGDWDFSTIGCAYSGDKQNTTLSLKIGAQAVYKPAIKELDKWNFKIDSGLQHKLGSDTVIGFLKNPTANGNYSCDSSNGVVVRFINRPSSNDNRTHILLLLNGKWVTIDGKEPAIIDADYYTVSIERNTDNHYYMRIKWENGTKLIKFERGSEYYSLVQLDELVESGAYFTFSSINNSIDAKISMTYSSASEDDNDESSKEITSFILEFEKNFDNLNARDKSTYEKMHAEWLKLSFLSRNSVMGDLMDDEAAYNLLLDVADYKDGNLDEYYTETEEKLVNKNELDAVIAECKADNTADYVISFANDGTVIENIKNLSASQRLPIFSAENANGAFYKTLCILSAAVISYGVIYAVQKRKMKKR